MSDFFIDCLSKKDTSSINIILDQIGQSTISFGYEILLYIVQNFNPTTQKIFDNIFKEAIRSEN